MRDWEALWSILIVIALFPTSLIAINTHWRWSWIPFLVLSIAWLLPLGISAFLKKNKNGESQ